MTSTSTSTTTMAAMMSFIFMFCHHILLRSCLPVLWNLSACKTDTSRQGQQRSTAEPYCLAHHLQTVVSGKADCDKKLRSPLGQQGVISAAPGRAPGRAAMCRERDISSHFLQGCRPSTVACSCWEAPDAVGY